MTTPKALQISANNGDALKAWHSFYYPDSITQSGTVSDIADLSGNAIDLTVGNNPAYVEESGNFINGALFDGSNDRLSSTSTIDFSTNNAATIFVVCRFVGNPQSVSSSETIVSQNDINSGNIVSISTDSPGRFSSDAFGGVSSDSYQDVDNDTHIIAIRGSLASGVRSMWIDGSYDHETAITFATASGEIGIGCNLDIISNYFNGFVFELACFDVALSDDEIVALSKDMGLRYNVDVNPIPSDSFLYIDPDSTKTHTVVSSKFESLDSRSSSVVVTNATASQRPDRQLSRLSGYIGANFKSGNSTQLIDSGAGSTSTEFTIFCVGKMISTGDSNTYARMAASNKGWQIERKSTGELSLNIGNGSFTAIESSGITEAELDVPHVVSAKFSGTTGTLYLNGVQIATGTATLTYATPDSVYGNANLTAKLGPWLFYERVLSDDEFDSVNANLMAKYANPLISSTLNAYYDHSKDRSRIYNGNNISSLRNINEFAYDISQSTASLQPALDGDGLKSHAAGVFTMAGGETFTIPDDTLPTPTALSIYVVGKITNTANYRSFIGNSNSGAFTTGYFFGVTNSNILWSRTQTSAGTQTIIATDIPATAIEIPFVACYRFDGTTQYIDLRNGDNSYSVSQAAAGGDITYTGTLVNVVFGNGTSDSSMSVIVQDSVAHDDDTMKTNMDYLLRQFNIG